MMQQQLYQQDAAMQEQVGQQMVLCPVRFVYETQMLMQPGEQIQQPQTILLNPQNPPPWIQNRPVQNRVIYVQQMPGNYMPSQPQHMDQSQLYIPNYGYQNIPQMLVQNQDQRTMQMIAPNIMANVQPSMGSVQANIGPNVQNPNVQRIISNVPLQNQVNIGQPVNQALPMNRQIISNPIVNVNEVVNNVETQEVAQPNMYRPNPQVIQDPRFSSQTVTMVPSNMQNTPRFEANPNVCHIRPSQTITPNIPPPYPRQANLHEFRKLPTVNKGTNFNQMNANVRNPVQMLRPIQPRPHQVRPNTNFLPIQPANAPNLANTSRRIMPNLIPAPSNTEASNTKNVTYNRKRKSESPDETHKKLPMNSTNDNVVVIKQIENVAKMTDVGVNTSPIHKPDGRIIINNMQITPINANQNSKIKEELKKAIRNTKNLEPQNVVRNITIQAKAPKSFSSLVEKEKLIRNTVYTQARGRLLNDKSANDVKQENATGIAKIEVSISNNGEHKTTEIKSLPIFTVDVKDVKFSVSESKVVELKQPQLESVFIEVKAKVNVSDNKTDEPTSSQIKDKPKPLYNKTAESLLSQIKDKPKPLYNKAAESLLSQIKDKHKTLYNKTAEPLPSQIKDKHKPLVNRTVESLPSQIKDKYKPLENRTVESLPSQIKDKYKPLENRTVESLPSQTKDKHKLLYNKTAESLPSQIKDKHKPLENKTAESKPLPKFIKEIKREKNVEPMDVVAKKDDVKVKSKIKQEPKPEEVAGKSEVKSKPEVKVKEDRDFILTHVLGGFVIQESNVAFPIRKPLKEKTLEINEVKKERERETKEIRNTSKILDISNLNIEECENMKGKCEDSTDKDNPFSSLKLSTVKQWTAEELSTHLSKYTWHETMSVLQEHEIDGESLSLVSKLQLISIGVSESHADIIAEFIKK